MMCPKKLLWWLLPLFIFSSVHAADPTPTQETIQLYWDGAGDTPSMSAFEYKGGYLRFTEFPVQVYLNWGADEVWEDALDTALRQLNSILPIVRTALPSQADIFIEVLPTSPCKGHLDEACSQMRPLGNPNTSNFDLISRIWVHEDASLPPEHLMLHELIHALGIQVHSPNPEDLMYNGTKSAPVALSLNDRAMLLYLYQQPAIGQ